MTTVSALPGTLFTLPAGAIADMIDRKKILCVLQLWQASIAIGLAILWLMNLRNPYALVASAFLFNVGFALRSPAQSAVIAEMVYSEASDSAYTLSGMQMDVSGIVGPFLGGILMPVIGASFIFGANGVGVPPSTPRDSTVETGTAAVNRPS